jgi:uncharacterized protein YrrD
MLEKAKTLIGCRLRSTDGEMGRLRDLYFDDRHWVVRYVVAQTGDWLDGKRVLLSPQSLASVDAVARRIEVGLTMSEIEHGPPPSKHRPVSERFELEYGWGVGMPVHWGFERERRLASRRIRHGDPDLRSVHSVMGYQIHATDGEIGRLDDFLVDDEAWAIRYLLVDTRRWLPGKTVLLSPDWIEHISWHHRQAIVGLDRESIRRSPAYRDDVAVERDYEQSLHRHYDRPGYWDDAGHEPTGKVEPNGQAEGSAQAAAAARPRDPGDPGGQALR